MLNDGGKCMKVGCIKGKDVRFVLAMVITTLIVVLYSTVVRAEGSSQMLSKGIIDFGNGIVFDATDLTNLESNLNAAISSSEKYLSNCQ